jgi:hypothetical protein
MGITGHRTEAVYRRYDIVSEKDMKLAASRMDEFFEAQRKDQKQKDLDAKRESRAQIGHSEDYPNPQAIENVVSRAGLEPATTALKVRCSTN